MAKKTMTKEEALCSNPEDCAYSFFSHKECEFFPCHQGAEPENFNCLFCYCPLYALGPDCGGNFRYTMGIKDCSFCLIPHQRNSYAYIAKRFEQIVEAMKKPDEVKNKVQNEVKK